MDRGLLLRILSSAALAATLVINALANILPINGLTTGEVADRYPSLFTPAGFTFGIWSVIYALLLAFIVYAWINRDNANITEMLPCFILSCVFNVTWILVWHHLMPLFSVLVMILLLLTLTRLFILAHTGQHDSRQNSIFVSFPFAIYFSWICVATIANVAAYLSSTEWNGFAISPEVWTVLMLSIATLLALRIFLVFRAPAVIAVLLWTLAGIFFRWRDSDYLAITVAAPVLGLLLIIAATLSSRHRNTTGQVS